MRQLTTLDAQFLAVESARTYGHVGGLAVYDPSSAAGGKLGLEDICDMLSERLHLLPPFRWRLAEIPFGLDLPYWVEDPDFDIHFHVRESAVPPPGTDRQIAETVARIYARPLDRSRPLWELYLIHGLKDDRVALLTKIHHSVVDGVSGNELLTVLLDPSPEGRELPPPERDKFGERLPGDLELLARGLLGVPRQPLRMLRSLPTALPHLTDLPGATAFPTVPTLAKGIGVVRRLLGDRDPHLLEVTSARAPRTCFNGPVSSHRRLAFGSLSLDAVKAIKNKLGITVNDVVVALCTTAVRNWLLERDALPEDPLVAFVPVSVRSEDERDTFGNRISAMIVPIPTNEPEPRRRLLQTHDLLKSAKNHHQAIPADLLTDATAFIPPAVAARVARTTIQLLGRTRPPVNLVISNVPGPRTPLYCAGAQLQANFPVSVVVDGVGLNITAMSYRDHLDFGIVADRDQIDDAWPMMELTAAALDELESVVHGRRARRRAAADGARPREHAPS